MSELWIAAIAVVAAFVTGLFSNNGAAAILEAWRGGQKVQALEKRVAELTEELKTTKAKLYIEREENEGCQKQLERMQGRIEGVEDTLRRYGLKLTISAEDEL